jgi:hypothetical protein
MTNRRSHGLNKTRFPWGKAFLSVLYTLFFMMMFTGAFDYPARGKGEGTAPSLGRIGSLLVSAVGGSEVAAADGSHEPAAGFSGYAGTEGLIPGDILLGRCRLSLVPSLNPHNGWTHAALYAGNDRVIVASNPRTGVMEVGMRSWLYPYMTWVVYMRVPAASEETRERAVGFAREQKGQPYDINWLSKQEYGDTWYCSEIIWAAYLHASEGRIDLARGPGWFGVSPDDIFNHRDTVVAGGHFEAKPDTAYSLLLKALAICILAGGAGILAPHPFFPLGRRRRL